MRYSVFGSEFIPCQCRAFMHRKYNPSCMVLSWLNSPVINPEISAKLQRCLYYVAPVPYVPVNAIPYPEIRLCFLRFFQKAFVTDFFASGIVTLTPLLLNKIKRRKQSRIS